jgi:uncharacterized protein GlcG (DUF336 family)
MASLSLRDAAAGTEAGLAAARVLGAKVNIALVDPAGHLLHFARMDGAWLGCIDWALKKAKTSALFCMPSAAVGELSQPGGPVYGVESTNGGLVTFGGGLPIHGPDGTVLGAVGVSGGSVAQDVEVAGAVAAHSVAAQSEAGSGNGAAPEPHQHTDTPDSGGSS